MRSITVLKYFLQNSNFRRDTILRNIEIYFRDMENLGLKSESGRFCYIY